MSGFQPFQQINSSSFVIALHFSIIDNHKPETERHPPGKKNKREKNIRYLRLLKFSKQKVIMCLFSFVCYSFFRIFG